MKLSEMWDTSLGLKRLMEDRNTVSVKRFNRKFILEIIRHEN